MQLATHFHLIRPTIMKFINEGVGQVLAPKLLAKYDEDRPQLSCCAERRIFLKFGRNLGAIRRNFATKFGGTSDETLAGANPRGRESSYCTT